MRNKKYIHNHSVEILVVIFALIFSFWLMFHTFQYNNGSFLISAKVWSDFAGNIPLIRSFSLGDNLPPQYPIFPGEPIRYHFLFYLLVGFLEKIGLQIDWALNLPSALSFSLLIISIYFLAKTFFQSRAVGILSVLFFLFNGSLSFLEFLKTHPFSPNFFYDISSLMAFPSFGPYDGKIVSAFWNLNIYTNQRHLAISYAFSLFLIFLVLLPIFKKTKLPLGVSVVLGILLGLSFSLHMAMFVANGIILCILFLLFPKVRMSIFVILAVAAPLFLPQYFYMQQSPSTLKPSFFFGYLATTMADKTNIFTYWFYNLGLHSIFILIGFFLAPKNMKKVFVSVFSIFILANTVLFSAEASANHKFINFFMIFGNMFTAFALVSLWKKRFLKPVVVVSVFFLIFSGIIDFFPVFNDQKITLSDYHNNPDVYWIIKHTSQNSVFLNTTFLYDPASLAGRKIFLGWPYFPWSAGYDTNARGALMAKILGSKDKEKMCHLLKENNLDYIGVKILLRPDPDIPPISSIFQTSFKPAYVNSSSQYSIYSVSKNCK